MSQGQILALGAALVVLGLGVGLGSGPRSTDAMAAEPAVKGALSADAGAQIINISARKFEFTPHLITLKRNVPYLLQITTTDRSHGFNIPSMHLRADVEPGKTAEVKLTPDKTGTFEFYCDIFCGSGHEDMSGQLKVTE